ncbi:MAG: hypothetical protein ACXWV4_05695 [Flavitalea sp.]
MGSNRKIEDWWLHNQVKLVTDESIIWHLQEFKPTRAAWIPCEEGRLLKKLEEGEEIPPGGILEERAWDHEHCELCHETISDKSEQISGYTNGDHWICISCYQTYILNAQP